MARHPHSYPTSRTASLEPVNDRRVLVYVADKGIFYHNGHPVDGITAVAGRYQGRNEPRASDQKNIGPPPMGTLYKLGSFGQTHLGPAFRMNPLDESKMCGRDGFLIHHAFGDGSHGCIGVKGDKQLFRLASYIKQSGISHLQVIDSRQVGLPSAEPTLAWQQRRFEGDAPPASFGERQPAGRYQAMMRPQGQPMLRDTATGRRQTGGSPFFLPRPDLERQTHQTGFVPRQERFAAVHHR